MKSSVQMAQVELMLADEECYLTAVSKNPTYALEQCLKQLERQKYCGLTGVCPDLPCYSTCIVQNPALQRPHYTLRWSYCCLFLRRWCCFQDQGCHSVRFRGLSFYTVGSHPAQLGKESFSGCSDRSPQDHWQGTTYYAHWKPRVENRDVLAEGISASK